MPIPEIIRELLTRRHTKVTSLKKVEAGLIDFRNALEKLKGLAQQTAVEPDAVVSAAFKQAVASVPQQIGMSDQVGSIQWKVGRLINEVNKIIERFQKDTINVGVMGLPKQGKSTTLQKISGLSNNEIPTAGGLPLTRAKSKIYHINQGTNPYAEVVFYNGDEFLQEIIHPYYDKLAIAHPKKLEQFFANPLPQLTLTDSDALGKAVFESLSFIHRGFSEFGHLLSNPSKRIELKEVKSYVAPVENMPPLYLAVKVVNIYTQFPNNDATGLCLVDLPGLEKVAQDQEKLARALEREVDAVLLVKMPSEHGAVWDEFEAISLIYRSLKQVELTDWLFIVLNQDANNVEQVKVLHRNPMSLYSSPQMLIANCSDSYEVQTKIFSPLLEHLAQNLNRIDKRYLQFLINDLEIIRSSLIDLEQPIRRFVGANNVLDAGDLRLFMDLFYKFMQKLRTELQILVGELRIAENKNNKQTFTQAVEGLCKQAADSPPVLSVDELRAKFFEKGGWPGAVQDQLHILRAHLTQHLCELDRALQSMLSEALQKVLTKVLPDGVLDSLLPKKVGNQLERLASFQELLDPNSHRNLHAAFAYLTKFHFSYHSHFHYRVREEMGPLDPLIDPNIIMQIAAVGGHSSEGAKNVANGLIAQYREAVNGVHAKLKGDMIVDPSRAIFALIEEFRDRAIWTQNIDNEWQDFLSIHRGQIWPNEFGQREKFKQLLSEWQTTLNDIIGCAGKIKTDFDI